MKILITFFISFLFLSFNTNIFSQNNCKVISEEMSGEYKGECKNGLAEGKGNFTFSNKRFMYRGEFKQGMMNGKGAMYTLKNGKYKLVREGVWIKNVFSPDLPPYEVKQTTNLDRYTVRKVDSGNKVMINFLKNGARNSVRNLNILVNNGVEVVGGSIRGYENVEFPFSCRLLYYTSTKLGTSSFEVTFDVVINEPGSWEITLNN